MKKSEFSQLVRDIIKEELSKNKELKQFLKEVVKSEVSKLLIEAESHVVHDSTGQDLVGSRHGIRLDELANRKISKKTSEKSEQPQEISFVKNQTLNKLLNETAYDIRTGKVALPSSTGGIVNQADVVKQLNENTDWNELRFDSTNARGFSGRMPDRQVKSVTSMMPTKDVAGNPMVVNPNALPDHVQNALTKNYSKFLKKVDEKSSGKRG
jgi:hypothetical protein